MAIDGVGRKKVDITRITGGLERKNLKTDQERSIFDAMDTDHNGILTDAEIKDFRKGNSANGTEGFDADGDGVITKSEAKKFIKAKGLKNLDIKNQDVIDFLKKYGEYSQNTASADITEEGIVVNYNDGSKKIINPETREYKIIKQDANTSATTATLFNADDVLQSEVIENGNDVVTTTFLNGNRDAVKSVVKENKGDNTTTVITYDATGQKIESEVITNNATNEVTTYNYENGIKKGKKVVRGTTETLYTIDGDNEVRTSMIENKGIDAKETLTTWTYNEDNTVTEDITCRGQNLHTVNTLNSENHRLTQTKEIDGATYNVEYDGQGNTTGIVIQRDETLKSLAEKFNCSVEDLKNLNEGVTFKPGQTIKVPAELDADDERLQNRRSASDIEAEIKREQDAERQRKLAAQRAQNQQLKRLGLINHKGAGQKIKGAYDLGRGKGYREEEFTVIGQASYDRVIARNKKGEIVVLSTEHHKNGWKGPRLVLKTEHVVNTETYRVGKKVNVGGRSVVITDQSRDAHGRMIAVDAQGRTVVVSGGSSKTDLSDRTIVSTSYATASDVADIYNDPQKRAEALKNGTMHLSVVNGEKIVYTRGADGKLWAFKIGANGKLVNQGAVNVNNALDADARAVKSYIGTPHAEDAVMTVAFPEMKNALDRVCEDDYSDTRSEDGLRGLSPAEQFLIEESSTRSEGRGLIRAMADAGAYGTVEATSAAIGRISAEEVNYELYGGNTLLGLVNTTHEADVSDALKLCTSPADRLAAERSIHSIHPEIEADEGSYMRGVIGDETGKLAGYRTAAVDRVIVSWVESGAYAQAQYLRDENGELKLDANGKPMLDTNNLGDQATINNLIDRMMFAQYFGADGDKIAGYRNFNDEDYRLTSHNLMSAIGNSKGTADYYVDEHGIIVNPAMECFRIRCADYVEANNLTPNITGEPPEETFIVNMSRSVNTGKLDFEHVEASNRMLYPESPAFINAEEAVLRTRETGNTLNLFQSDDPAVYEELSIIAGSGDLGGNVLTLNDALHQMKGNQEAQDMAIARAYVYGGLSMDANMASNLALRLADRIDRRSHGGAASGGLEGQEIRIQEEILFRELTARVAQNDPSQIKVLRTAIQNRNYAKGNTVISFESILKEAEQIGNATPEFYAYDETYAYNRRPVTDPAEIETLRAKYMESLGEFSAHINQLGRDFQMKVDAEGSFSSFADGVRNAGNFGHTRREYRNVYRQTREMNRRLELAAQGLLRNSNGTVITFEQEAARCQEQLKKLAAEAESYEEAQEYTKMAIVLAPVVVATAPVSTSGVVATAVVAGGSTAVVEGTAMMIEHETAVTPTSTRAEVMTNIAVRATEDAAFGAAIPAAGKVIAAAGRGVGHGIQYVSKVARARRINRIRANRLASETPVRTPNLSTDAPRSTDISMLDANKRKLVEDARAVQPTQEELSAYASEHAYQPPTPEQRVIIDQNNTINAQNYTDAHRIENVATISHVKPQGAGNQVKALENQIGGLNKKIKSLENRIKNAKAGEDTQALQAELDRLTELRSKKIEELNALKNPAPAEPTLVEPKPEIKPEPTPEVKPELTPEVKPEPKPVIDNNVEVVIAQNHLPEGFRKVTTPEEAQSIYDDIVKSAIGDSDAYLDSKASMYDDKNWIRSWITHHHETKWKMHIYADSPQEWADAAQLSIPYLREHKVEFKTVRNLDEHIEKLRTANGGTQKGKAFTIYFKNEEEFLTVAQDLEKIFNESGLKSSGRVVGEGQIGNSGFLSYRNSLGERGTLAPKGMVDPWAQHVSTRKPEPKPAVTPEPKPAARTPVSPEASVLSKADYDRSIIGLNNSDEISAMRAKIKNDANLTPQEKIQLNNLLDQQEMKLNSVKPTSMIEVADFADDEVVVVSVPKPDAKPALTQSVHAIPAGVNSGSRLTSVQVNNLLLKSGLKYSHSQGGVYVKSLGLYEKTKLKMKFGAYADDVINNIKKTLSKNDIENIRVMLNALDENTRTILLDDINDLLNVYQNVKLTQIFSNIDDMKPGNWESVVNVIKNKPSGRVIGALADYKGINFGGINEYLWGNAGAKVDPVLMKEIDCLSNYIDTQVIHSPMIVKRRESYGKLFAGIQFKDGNMDVAMRQAEEHYKMTGDRTLIDEIENYFDYQSADAEVKGFMSATLAGDAPISSGDDICITIHARENSKVVFLDAVVPGEHLKNETEVLFQKGSHMNIAQVKYENGHWNVDCSMYN